MASNLNLPSLWRLRSGGGIPFKLLSTSGSFQSDTAEIVDVILIHEIHLENFIVEVFPIASAQGFIVYPTPIEHVIIFGIFVTNLTFESFDEAFPIDPFAVDVLSRVDPVSPPQGTYFPAIKVTLTYTPLPYGDIDPEKPETFIEVSGNTTGEFIHVPPSSLEPEDDSIPNEQAKTTRWAQEDATEPPNENTGRTSEATETTGTEENRDPNLPITVLVPKTEWTLVWRNIPIEYWRAVLVHRVRFLQGKVNNSYFSLLNNAPPTTLLLAGFNFKQETGWRTPDPSAYTGRQTTITLTLKIIEKFIVEDDKVIGHNHVYRPGKGWTRLVIDSDSEGDGRYMYKGGDFNFLFQI